MLMPRFRSSLSMYGISNRSYLQCCVATRQGLLPQKGSLEPCLSSWNEDGGRHITRLSMYRQCPPINCQAACLGLQFSTVLSYTAQKFRSLQGGANQQNHEASQQAPQTHPMTTLMGNLHDSPPFCYVCNKMWGCLLLCSWPWMAKFCHPAIVDPFGKNRTAARKPEQVWVSLCLWLFGVSPMADVPSPLTCRNAWCVLMDLCHVYVSCLLI